MVIVADVEHLVARTTAVLAAIACDAMAHLVKVGEFLRVEVEQVAGGFVFIAVRRFLSLER
jgi:hypothetical protein